MVEVKLTAVAGASVERDERTYTDNLSAHGARVHSTTPWQLGEQAEVTPVRGEPSLRGEVVYCQKAGNERFFVGLKFRDGHNSWSIFERFNGPVIVNAF